MTVPTYIFIGVVALTAVVLAVRWVIWRIHLGDSRVDMILAALKNNDSSQRFPERGKYSRLNSRLNEISAIIGDYQREIARSEKFNEIVLDVAVTGIIVADERGYVVKCNRCALDLMGREVITHLCQLSPAVTKALERINPGESCTVESDNGALTLSITELLINDRTLKIYAINDIERAISGEEVGAWSRLTRVLTHEIMNSLSPVTSISETLLSTPDSEMEKLRDGLRTIHDMSISLVSFVDAYREISRPVVPVPGLFDVLPLLRTMVGSIQAAPGIISGPDCPPDLMLYADQHLISRVIHNLLLNAVQAVEGMPDGRVIIRASLGPAERVFIDVINNGPQIPQDIAQNIFTPFFTTKQDGTGVGLSISRQIMIASGGSINLLPYADEKSPTVFRLIFD